MADAKPKQAEKKADEKSAPAAKGSPEVVEKQPDARTSQTVENKNEDTKATTAPKDVQQKVAEAVADKPSTTGVPHEERESPAGTKAGQEITSSTAGDEKAKGVEVEGGAVPNAGPVPQVEGDDSSKKAGSKTAEVDQVHDVAGVHEGENIVNPSRANKFVDVAPYVAPKSNVQGADEESAGQ